MQSKSIPLLAIFLSWMLSAVGVAFEMRPQPGHTETVLAVAFSPNGRYLVSGSFDRTARLWEVSSGKLLRVFQGSSGSVTSVVFHPTGLFFATASSDGSVRLWETETGKEMASVARHKGGTNAVAFSPDGQAMASAGADGLVRYWKGTAEITFKGHSNNVTSVAFSPDGKYLVSGSWDNTLKLWDISTGKELRTFTGHTNTASAVAFSPDGKYLVSSSADSPDGTFMAEQGADPVVRVWDVSSGKQLQALNGHQGSVRAVTYSPDGATIASVGADKKVRRWDAASGKELSSWAGHQETIRAVAFSPNGKLLATAGGDDLGDEHSIRLWDVSGGALLRSLSAPTDVVAAVSYSPDGRFLATGSWDNTIHLWDLQSAHKTRSFFGHTNNVTSVAFSPDGQLLASGSWDKSVRLWELSTGRELSALSGHNNFVTSVTFSPDGKTLAAGGWSGEVLVWEVTSGKKLQVLRSGDNVESIAFSPDGKTLAVAGWGKVIKLFDTATSKNTLTFKGHTNVVSSVAFSPDGKTLSSASWDGTALLWDVATGKQLVSTTGETIAFSPDGKRVVSGAGRLVKLWDSATGKELQVFTGHSSRVAAVTFSPDNKYLASGSRDGTLRLWRLDGKASLSMVSSTEGEWLIYNEEGYFDSSPGGVGLVAAVDGLRGYNIDQLALKFNRPDLLLKSMGLGSAELIEYYKKRALDRLKKAKIKDEASLNGSFEKLPTARVSAKLSASKQEAEAAIKLQDSVGLRSYQIYINGVALYEGFGREASGTELSVTETIALTQGENRIEVSALNVSGQESLRAIASLSGPDSLTRDLYFIGFGVSDYQDEDIPDLLYAHKDAKELGDSFSALQGYKQRYIKTFTNEEVTKESLIEAKAIFAKARPQDTVVLFIAGHGLHDRDELATYYYVIHGTQLSFNKDGTIKLNTSTAVSFEEIEGLLSGIGARQKLFLMDTCESGEREDAGASISLGGVTSRGLQARAIGIAKVTAVPTKAPKKPKKTKSTARPWLLERERYIYQDLAKRTGAVVLSSSKGGEFSFEDPKLENGLFTEAIIKSLSANSADQNKDGSINTEELRAYTSREVAALSNGLQHPTIDRNNPYLRLSFQRLSGSPEDTKPTYAPTSLVGHKDNVRSVAFLSGGDLLSGGFDGAVKRWEIPGGGEKKTTLVSSGGVSAIALSPDQKTLACALGNNTIALIELSSGKELSLLSGHKSSIQSIALSPDGKLLASGGSDKLVKIWEVSSGKLLLTLSSHTAAVYSIAFSPSGKLLASAGMDKTVRLWEMPSGKELRALSENFAVISLAFSPDGKTLALGGADGPAGGRAESGSVSLLDVSSGEITKRFKGHTNFVSAIAFSFDGKTLLSGGWDASILLWEVSSGKQIKTLSGGDKILSLSLSQDGKYLAAADLTLSPKIFEVGLSPAVQTRTEAPAPLPTYKETPPHP